MLKKSAQKKTSLAKPKRPALLLMSDFQATLIAEPGLK